MFKLIFINLKINNLSFDLKKMQSKTTKIKSVQDDIDNLKKRREERKAKENRKITSSNHEGRLMDKDYEKIFDLKIQQEED